jgi:hypothetical protein
LAVRQKSSFKVAFVGTQAPVQVPYNGTSTSSSSPMKWNLALMNKDLSSPNESASSKIQMIAKRNLNLALITVASTAATSMFVYFANASIPPRESPSARSYYYLLNLAHTAALADSVMNSISVLLMTSSWQPLCLKRIVTKVTASRNTVRPDEESDVSTLGGGS